MSARRYEISLSVFNVHEKRNSISTSSHVLLLFIIWLCLTRTGNYQIHEFDWLKRILTVV